MTPDRLAFTASDRLLVLAPHPDDESLGTGGLIQAALAAGAALRVIVATDGENNPWPQRWIERRWHIDEHARLRWAQQRRMECAAALSILGVDDPDVIRLGWPDLGLTDLLMHDAAAESLLARHVNAFAPTHVALPVARDRHPDHSALHVLAERALAQSAWSNATRLNFLVHGVADSQHSEALVLTDAQQLRKRNAVLAHASQIRLSRSRLLRFAERPECFEPASSADHYETAADAREWSIPLSPSRLRWVRHEVLLVLSTAKATLRARLPFAGSSESTLRFGADSELVVKLAKDRIKARIRGNDTLVRGYLKLQRADRGLVIYDREGWKTLSAPRAGEIAAQVQAPYAAA